MRVDKKEIKIEYCPTGQMLEDYFTKPLQGSLFRLFRSVLMGHRPISDLYTISNIVVKERVENVTNNEKISRNVTTNKNNKVQVTWSEKVSKNINESIQ